MLPLHFITSCASDSSHPILAGPTPLPRPAVSDTCLFRGTQAVKARQCAGSAVRLCVRVPERAGGEARVALAAAGTSPEQPTTCSLTRLQVPAASSLLAFDNRRLQPKWSYTVNHPTTKYKTNARRPCCMFCLQQALGDLT